MREPKPRVRFRNSARGALAELEVGDYLYIESTYEGYAKLMRALLPPPEKRARPVREWEFTTSMFVAISSSNAGDIRYLVRVERTA